VVGLLDLCDLSYRYIPQWNPGYSSNVPKFTSDGHDESKCLFFFIREGVQFEQILIFHVREG